MHIFMSFIITEVPVDTILDVLPMRRSTLVVKRRNYVFLDTIANKIIVLEQCRVFFLKHFPLSLETKICLHNKNAES